MKKVFLFLILLFFLASSLQAAVILANDWEGGGETWFKDDSFGNPSTVLGNPASIAGETALSITGGDASGDSEAYIYNNNTLKGNYNSIGALSVSFDFYSESPSAGLSLYFVNGVTEWFYDISSLSAGWNTYDINFWASGDGWSSSSYALGGSQGDLNADLLSVDEIGLLLSYQPNIANQSFALDNFNVNDVYFIPEPETYLMLAFAFISLAITFRKRLDESLCRVLATIK